MIDDEYESHREYKSLQSDGYVGYVFLDDDLVDIEHIYLYRMN